MLVSLQKASCEEDATSTAAPDATAQDKQKAGSWTNAFAADHLRPEPATGGDNLCHGTGRSSQGACFRSGVGHFTTALVRKRLPPHLSLWQLLPPPKKTGRQAAWATLLASSPHSTLPGGRQRSRGFSSHQAAEGMTALQTQPTTHGAACCSKLAILTACHVPDMPRPCRFRRSKGGWSSHSQDAHRKKPRLDRWLPQQHHLKRRPDNMLVSLTGEVNHESKMSSWMQHDVRTPSTLATCSHYGL